MFAVNAGVNFVYCSNYQMSVVFAYFQTIKWQILRFTENCLKFENWGGNWDNSTKSINWDLILNGILDKLCLYFWIVTKQNFPWNGIQYVKSLCVFVILSFCAPMRNTIQTLKLSSSVNRHKKSKLNQHLKGEKQREKNGSLNGFKR